jgi:hypothetical protein
VQRPSSKRTVIEPSTRWAFDDAVSDVTIHHEQGEVTIRSPAR